MNNELLKFKRIFDDFENTQVVNLTYDEYTALNNIAMNVYNQPSAATGCQSCIINLVTFLNYRLKEIPAEEPTRKQGRPRKNVC